MCRRRIIVESEVPGGRIGASAVDPCTAGAGPGQADSSGLVDPALIDGPAALAERLDYLLMEREVSLRLLRHIASSVRHQQFHDTDIVTVRVDAPATGRGGSQEAGSPMQG